MKSSRLKGWLAVTVLFILVCIFVAAAWLPRQRSLASGLANDALAEGIDQASGNLREGPTPDDWPRRGFVPTSFLKQATAAFRGATVLIPSGPQINGHVDGYLHLRISSFELVPSDAKMGVKITATATYESDRVRPWWRGVSANLLIDAVLLPTGQFEENKAYTTNFQVVPDAISVLPGWQTLDPRRPRLLDTIIADQVSIHWGQRMVLPVPALTIPIDVDENLNSSSYQPFAGDGGTNIVVTMKRPP
jgi:hypothetical protein